MLLVQRVPISVAFHETPVCSSPFFWPKGCLAGCHLAHGLHKCQTVLKAVTTSYRIKSQVEQCGSTTLTQPA